MIRSHRPGDERSGGRGDASVRHAALHYADAPPAPAPANLAACLTPNVLLMPRARVFFSARSPEAWGSLID